MTFKTLRMGDYGPAVGTLQEALDEVGIETDADRKFGMLTRRSVMCFQKLKGLRETGVADEFMQRILFEEAAMTNGQPRVSERGIQLILDYEVGGGQKYYDFMLSHPTVPPAESGVTIGVGYDLGYESIDPWRSKLGDSEYRRLSACVGATGIRAQRLLSSVKDILIPWKSAYEVFEEYTLPREIEKTARVFPGMEKLHPDIQGVLVSLVFNRGTSMHGDKRAEMRDIRDAVERCDVEGVEKALRRMKRLWPNIKGLRIRRDAEADLVSLHTNKNTGTA